MYLANAERCSTNIRMRVRIAKTCNMPRKGDIITGKLESEEG